MMEPNSAPKINERNSNCWSAFAPRPNNGINPIMKKSTRTTPVHFIFSLKESLFWLGLATSGRLLIMVSYNDIILLHPLLVLPAYCLLLQEGLLHHQQTSPSQLPWQMQILL